MAGPIGIPSAARANTRCRGRTGAPCVSSTRRLLSAPSHSFAAPPSTAPLAAHSLARASSPFHFVRPIGPRPVRVPRRRPPRLRRPRAGRPRRRQHRRHRRRRPAAAAAPLPLRTAARPRFRQVLVCPQCQGPRTILAAITEPDPSARFSRMWACPPTCPRSRTHARHRSASCSTIDASLTRRLDDGRVPRSSTPDRQALRIAARWLPAPERFLYGCIQRTTSPPRSASPRRPHRPPAFATDSPFSPWLVLSSILAQPKLIAGKPAR